MYILLIGVISYYLLDNETQDGEGIFSMMTKLATKSDKLSNKVDKASNIADKGINTATNIKNKATGKGHYNQHGGWLFGSAIKKAKSTASAAKIKAKQVTKKAIDTGKKGIKIVKKGAKISVEVAKILKDAGTCIFTFKRKLSELQNDIGLKVKFLGNVIKQCGKSPLFCVKLATVIAASVGTGGAGSSALLKLCATYPDECGEIAEESASQIIQKIKESYNNDESFKKCVDTLAKYGKKIKEISKE